MESTPKIAHAYHMQAHLAMRIGKWDRTCDWSVRALELEREYHRIQNVNPRDDFQFSHHLETCMTSLLHEGRYAEAHSIRTEAEKYGWSYQQNFLALAIAERDWEEALKLIQKNRKGDKSQLAYQMAMLYLEQGQLDKAKAELEVLQNLQKQRKSDKSAEVRFNTAEGWLLCQTGSGEAGLKLLQRAVDKTKDDYNHHAWGRGSSLMEIWGVAALQAGDIPAAEEAFQEALAHDAGSARAALGLYAMCNRLDRKEEAERYLKVAQRCWQRADSVVFEKTKDSMLSLSAKLPKRSVTVSADTSVNR
jgi:Tfp pilus assembly protein PilF